MALLVTSSKDLRNKINSREVFHALYKAGTAQLTKPWIARSVLFTNTEEKAPKKIPPSQIPLGASSANGFHSNNVKLV